MRAIWNKVLCTIMYIYNLFDSIEILDNPILNFISKIGVVLLAFILIKAILKSIFKPYKPSRETIDIPRYSIQQPTTLEIEQCISQEDLKFQMNKAEEEILDVIQRNKRQIADTLKRANQRIDVSWLESCNRILSISNTLDNNLAYYSKRNLEISKFQYYTQLHFRSMRAADIVHCEYTKVDQSFNEINQFIVRMKNHREFRGRYKAEVHEQKNQIKSIRNAYLNRVHNMNHETEIMRDKIGNECGEKGREWWLKRTRYKR